MTNPAATFRVDGASSGTAPISALGGSATERPSTPVATYPRIPRRASGARFTSRKVSAHVVDVLLSPPSSAATCTGAS